MPILTPGEQLLQGLDTTNLKQMLWDLPARILTERLREGEARKAVEEVKSRLFLREAELTAHIASAMDEKGKSVYGNAEGRAAALLRDKADDYTYQSLQAELRDAQTAAEQAQAQRQFSEDQFAAVRTLGRLIAAEADLLAAK